MACRALCCSSVAESCMQWASVAVEWHGLRSRVGWVLLASRDVMLAWWWHRVVDGWGWAVTWVAMSERKKKEKEKALNKVSSQGRIVAVGSGIGVTSQWCFVGGNVGQSKQKGLVGSELAWWHGVRAGYWQKLMETGSTSLYVVRWQGSCSGDVVCEKQHRKKKKENISRSARPSSLLSCILRWHGVGAELSRSGVLVVEIDGDSVRNDTKKKKPLLISLSSAGVLGGFAQWGDDGGELEAMAGAMG
ncbi:hypothetical protein EDB86DRAFT_2825264 [Lactarius hatsudake]|nr:hypothetical protein EDB86DRAFT_2825264 [Lactarius hatsudake]